MFAKLRRGSDGPGVVQRRLHGRREEAHLRALDDERCGSITLALIESSGRRRSALSVSSRSTSPGSSSPGPLTLAAQRTLYARRRERRISDPARRYARIAAERSRAAR